MDSTHLDSDSDDGSDADVAPEGLNYYIPAPQPSIGGSQGQNIDCLRIVDTSGIHTMNVHWCQCHPATAHHRQLLQLGLFPASTKCPKTAFTFDVLDDFLLDNWECKTAAESYVSKIIRATTKGYPGHIPVKIDPFPLSYFA